MKISQMRQHILIYFYMCIAIIYNILLMHESILFIFFLFIFDLFHYSFIIIFLFLILIFIIFFTKKE